MPTPFSPQSQTGKPSQQARDPSAFHSLPKPPSSSSWLSTPLPAPPQPRQPRPPRRKRMPRPIWSVIQGACFCIVCRGRGERRAKDRGGYGRKAMPTCTHSACPMPSTHINRGAYTTARTVQVAKIFELPGHVERLATTASLMWPDQGKHSGRKGGKGIRQGARSKATSSCSSDFGLKAHSLCVCNNF